MSTHQPVHFFLEALAAYIDIIASERRKTLPVSLQVVIKIKKFSEANYLCHLADIIMFKQTGAKWLQ